METTFLIPLLLLLISVGIGVVIKQNAKQSSDTADVKDAVNEVKVEQATLNATVTTVVKRVDDLHAWKNQLQERESTELRRTIEQMRRESGRGDAA